MGIASAENRLGEARRNRGVNRRLVLKNLFWPHLLLEFVCLSETAFYLSEVRKTSGAEKTGPEEDEINGEQPADFFKKKRGKREFVFLSAAHQSDMVSKEPKDREEHQCAVEDQPRRHLRAHEQRAPRRRRHRRRA